MRILLPARLLIALRPESASRLELPSDVVRESRRRVRVAAAIGAAAYALFLLVQTSGVLGGTAVGRRIDFVHDLTGMFRVCRYSSRRASSVSQGSTILAVALGVEVLLSLLISIAVPWGYLRDRTGLDAHLVVLIIVLFPPGPGAARTTLAVSTLCALAMPVGLAFLAASGRVLAAIGFHRPVPGRSSRRRHRLRCVAHRLWRWPAYGRGAKGGSYELPEPLGQGGMGEV
jgi:hypothetical protein